MRKPLKLLRLQKKQQKRNDSMKHRQVKQQEYYKAEGNKVERLKKVCNRCGDGTFMAEHKDRLSCGKCGMTIFKKEDEKPSKKKEKASNPEKTEATKGGK